MKKMLRVSSFLLILIMVSGMIFSGCGSTADKTDASATTSSNSSVESSGNTSSTETNVGWDTNKKDKVVISVINNYYTAGEKQLAKDYMALHPETEVMIDVVADNDSYMTSLKTKITTDKNTAADIVHGNFATSVAGSWSASYEKGYILDLASMLDEENPYNDNKKVREVFSDSDIAEAISNASGKLGFMPFDRVGVGVYYNKTIFNKLGLKEPSSIEEWLDTCKKLKDAGYENPIAASFVGGWVLSMLGDIAYRPMTAEFLTLPGDAAYDEATMSANTKIKYDPNDAKFDQYAVFNAEKIAAYIKKNTTNTPISKQIWTTFSQIGQYFQKNWTNPDDTKLIPDFENQNAPMMLHGSWNVGKLVDEINKLPKDKQFEWGVFKIPGYANPPAGFEAKIRSLYVFGNQMSIIQKDDQDHMARVKDVYKYWMSPKVAQMMYEETLSNGNYVQGPPAIKGVELNEETKNMLNGFVSEGNMRADLNLVGQDFYMQADKPIYSSVCNKLTDGTMSIDDFMIELSKINMKRNDEIIKQSGFDLNPATKDTAQK
jgi:ABC-type glycerol-3-phosphate transport system substrate-binding protein